MATHQQQPIGQAPARAVTGPQVGWADNTVSTSKESVDLSAWAGLRVRIAPEGGDVYYFFDADGSTSMQTGAASTVGTQGVPHRVEAGGWHFRVIPSRRPFLNYQAVSGSGHTLRVTPC